MGIKTPFFKAFGPLLCKRPAEHHWRVKSTVIDFVLTSMNETTEILKVDEAGRVRTPRERQEVVLDEFERSGMTGMQFSRHEGVKYPTLMNWVQRRRRERQDGESKAGREQWIEAVVGGGGSGLVVEVHGGVIMRVAAGGPMRARRGGLARAGLRSAMLSFTGSLRVFVAMDPCDICARGLKGCARW
jgi:hypothetical protein